MDRIKQILRWATDTTLKFFAHGGENTSTPHDTQEFYKPKPPEYRP